MRLLLALVAVPSIAVAVPVQYTHRGQVLGQDGQPINGTADITVSLCPTASPTPGEVCYDELFANTPVDAGHYQVRLGASGALDHTFLDQPELFVQVGIDGIALGGRAPLDAVPYATHVRGGFVDAAEMRVDGMLLLGSAPDSACTPDTVGAVITRDASIAVCDGNQFVDVVTRSIKQGPGGRTWSDGTLATSCFEYRYPDDEVYRYEGDVGDGIYLIDPDGTGSGGTFPVQCRMDEGWTRIYRQAGSALWTVNQLDRNTGSPTAGTYAILSQLEHFRRNGRFEMAMTWPGSGFTATQRWYQTSNPVTAAPDTVPTGCVGISIPYTYNGWGCLQRTRGSWSILDGTISPAGNWYYAVGTTTCWGSPGACYPGPTGQVGHAELWVR